MRHYTAHTVALATSVPAPVSLSLSPFVPLPLPLPLPRRRFRVLLNATRNVAPIGRVQSGAGTDWAGKANVGRFRAPVVDQRRSRPRRLLAAVWHCLLRIDHWLWREWVHTAQTLSPEEPIRMPIWDRVGIGRHIQSPIRIYPRIGELCMNSQAWTVNVRTGK